MQNVIDKAIKYVKEVFDTDYSGHDFFHTLRVYKMASRIAESENANAKIVCLAALLHDVDDIKLSPETYENKDKARSFLETNGINKDDIETICKIIDEVSYKGSDSVSPETIEGKCVQDADRLDAIGAIGIARTFTFGGHHNRVLHDPDIKPNLNMNADEYRNHISTTINHFYEKLLNLEALMNTDTAKALAYHRQEYMKNYLLEFMDEWEGLK